MDWHCRAYLLKISMRIQTHVEIGSSLLSLLNFLLQLCVAFTKERDRPQVLSYKMDTDNFLQAREIIAYGVG